MEFRRKPIIMTATMGAADFAWADALRQKYYPVEKNQLPAHITLFHHLPPQGLDEIVRLAKKTTEEYSCPLCTLMEVMQFDGGVAYRLSSPQLLELRQFFVESFHGLLVQQDQQKPRFHVTVQNKVAPDVSKKLFRELCEKFETRSFEITGLALFYYLEGPWEEIGRWRFRGKSTSI
ncbi:MAG: 2'-5' RNA ligase family protein [Parasphingorhabdus sp.]